MFHVLQQLDPSTVTDFIPQEVRERQRLLPRVDALRELHFPSDQATLDLYNRAASPAHCRIIFEEFFWLVLALAIKRQHRAAEPKGTNIELTDRVRQALLQILPFKPTNAQKRVLKEIVTDMASTKPMNRMLQGDVGAGKTIVAAQAAVVAIENGYQVALMVPTEILAEQHARNFRRLWEKTNYRVELLVGSLPAKQKRAVHTALREGEINLVVGTHALIQDKVDFAQLGLVIIDEQHRFGVIQRAQLIRRGQHPDVLVMTATPIPRSLTMTVYGDLDISIIDELPPGRTPIQTRLCGEKQRAEVYEFIKQQIACGYQCYIVYPLVEESEKIDLLAATAMAEKLQKEVFPELTVALLHGRMKAFEKEEIMQKFIYNEAQILVSTTVIEVGVDVPNASVMLIEHAERFGLSQIHQLRGRVGRGATQSYCLLMSEAHSREALARLRVLEKTTDGFKIAEKDLEIRGPGDVFGTRQAGEQFFRIANIVRDRSLLEAARHEAEYLLQSRREHPEVKHLIEQIASQARFGWAKVG
jgi:ATP-dependent DNA helicase RecG